MTIGLSVSERLILRNQYEILSLLNPAKENTRLCEKAIEILESGYESHYSELMPWPEKSLCVEDSKFVEGILDMFDNIAKAVEEDGIEISKEHKYHAEFRGFDGRCDGEYIGYAQFLIRKDGRFPRFKDLDLNSSFPVSIVKFHKMLDVWQSLPVMEQLNLSASNLEKILAA